MYCIKRPPNRLPSAFESAGNTISLRSDCDSATVRSKTKSLIPTSLNRHNAICRRQATSTQITKLANPTPNEILTAAPTNAFARYGLAMEHISQGNTDTALAEFTTLIQHNPDYVPAYQMSAQTLARLGRTDQALERLHAGIATANRTNNQHALAEMEA